MKAWAITDKGIVRKQNQDTFYTYCNDDSKFALLVVCDGMGGAKAGNIASLIAAEKFSSIFKDAIESSFSTKDAEKHMASAIDAANEAVFNESANNPDYRGMGTTLVAAGVFEDYACVANIGDSRAYLISPKYGIKQITRDHSVVEDLIARGDITRAEAMHHPNKNLITRALGTVPNIRSDFFFPQIEEGDYLLLCSDGLSNIVSEQEFVYEVLRADTLEEAGEKLLKLGFMRGAPDNITIVLFKK